MKQWFKKRLIAKGHLTCILFVLMNITVNAQTKTVTGNIKDEQGIEMPGVNIRVKSATNGTVSDSKGNYTIKLPSNEATLVFSFQGYQSQEIATAGKTTINVSMTPSIESL